MKKKYYKISNVGFEDIYCDNCENCNLNLNCKYEIIDKINNTLNKEDKKNMESEFRDFKSLIRI